MEYIYGSDTMSMMFFSNLNSYLINGYSGLLVLSAHKEHSAPSRFEGGLNYSFN